MDNSHVAEPFRDTLNAMGGSGGNIMELHIRSERLSMDLGRKKFAVDVLQVLLDAKNVDSGQRVERVKALCDREARK